MKTKFQIFLGGAVFMITLICALAFQPKNVSQEKSAPDKVPEKVKAVISDQISADTIPLDSLLPDSTKAKMRRVDMLGKKLDAVTQKTIAKNKIEERQNIVLEQQVEKVGRLVQESPFVAPLPVKSDSVKGEPSDTVPVTVPATKKKKIFKRLFDWL